MFANNDINKFVEKVILEKFYLITTRVILSVNKNKIKINFFYKTNFQELDSVQNTF